jgi:hypothetical protein
MCRCLQPVDRLRHPLIDQLLDRSNEVWAEQGVEVAHALT